MSDDEIASSLRSAVEGAEWVPVSTDNAHSAWRTSDSSVFAYYNHSPGHYALRVQTAAVDAIYQKTNTGD
jgi:hypothetical protein